MLELWLAVVQLVPYAVVGGATVAVGWRVTSLRRRQHLLAEASRRLVEAGFAVTPVTEHYATGNPAHAADVELTTALLARRGAHLDVAVASASRAGVRGLLRRRAVTAAARATFEVRREDALSRARHKVGVHDIEIGDAAFDDVLKLSGWPTDGARALVAAPPVRAAIEQTLSFDGVDEVRLAASAEAGMVRVTWRLPMEQLGALAAIGDTVERLAAALEDARWVEPMGKPERAGVSAGTSGPSSGAPMAIPGSGPHR